MSDHRRLLARIRSLIALARVRSRQLQPPGFTLIEVLISIVIMSFISMGIYQAITQTYRLRDNLLHEGEFYNGIQLALGILERDFSMLYSPTLMIPPEPPAASTGVGPDGQPLPPGTNDVQNNSNANPNANADSSQVTPFWLPSVGNSGIRPSHFIGTDTRLSFVSSSNVRIYKDSPESEFAKIRYELQPDKTEGAEPNSQTLVKIISPNAFAEDDSKDTFQKTYLLLYGIRKFKITYFAKNQKDPTGGYQSNASWDNEAQDHRGEYPAYIEIALEVASPTRQFFEGTYRFRVETPLNGIPTSF